MILTPVRDFQLKFDERSIDSVFAAVNQCQLPGAAVGIAIDGKPVYRKGFGLASLESPWVLSPSMRMRIGSTSKQFTAFTYMMLCEAGRARLDDTIGMHLPDLHPVIRAVTMRELMGNISGIRDATDLAVQFSGHGQGRRVTTEDLLSLYRDVDDVSVVPASTFIYNNGGWVVLGAVIEKITGQALEQVMWEQVFEPVGMYDTLLRRWDSTFVTNSASCHTLSAAGQYERTETCGGIDYAGAGAVVSTVNDMLRWMAHMDAPRVGSQETWRLMKTPQTLRNGTSTGYGLGLETVPYRGVETLQHAGGGFGSGAQMLKVPAAGLDVVVMVNRSDEAMAVGLVEQILDCCLMGLEPVSPASHSDRFPKGVFRSPTTGRVIRLSLGGVPWRTAEQMPLLTVDGHRFACAEDEQGTWGPGPGTWNYSVTSMGGSKGSARIRFSDYRNLDELVEVQAAVAASGSSIAGRYRSDTTGTDIVISATPEGARIHVSGRFGSAAHRLECIAEGLWLSEVEDVQAKPPWSLLSFEAGGQEFRWSNLLNKGLRFRRVS